MDTTAPIGAGQGQEGQQGQPGKPGQQGQQGGQQSAQDILAGLDAKIKTEQFRKVKGEADAIEMENDATSSGIMALIDQLAQGGPGAVPNA